MGKNKGEAQEDHAPAEGSEKKSKADAKAAQDGEDAQGKLARLRPKKRICFFVLFLAVNVWFAVVYDPCAAARKKKRTDCGWSGVSPGMCRTGACFLQAGTSDKFSVEIANDAQQKFGMKVTKAGNADIFIKAIANDGLIHAHNSKQSAGSDQLIQVGDRIAKLNGHQGANIQSELARKKGKAKFEIMRPTSAIARNVPAFLDEYLAGQVLKSAGFERWLESFFHVGGVGVMSWFLSGYPISSLPVYYLGVSAASSWYMFKCCHDERGAKQGDPHCFSHGITDFKSGIGLAINQTTKKRAEGLFGWLP